MMSESQNGDARTLFEIIYKMGDNDAPRESARVPVNAGAWRLTDGSLFLLGPGDAVQDVTALLSGDYPKFAFGE